jgi:hypothetical protein
VDAFEAYVDLTEGQGPIYDAGFVESHAIVRRERDDQDQDLVALGTWDQRGRGIQQRRDHARRSGFTRLLQQAIAMATRGAIPQQPWGAASVVRSGASGPLDRGGSSARRTVPARRVRALQVSS